jgi:hypothetical protein
MAAPNTNDCINFVINEVLHPASPVAEVLNRESDSIRDTITVNAPLN